MARTEVTKVIKTENGSVYAFNINHDTHMIEWEHVKGAAISFNDAVNVALTDRDMLQELKWVAEEYSRVHPISFSLREGMSGCKDLILFASKARHEWAKNIGYQKVASLHISCAGKMNEGIPDMFSGDFFEILNQYYIRIGYDIRDIIWTDIAEFYVRRSYKYIKPSYREEVETL